MSIYELCSRYGINNKSMLNILDSVAGVIDTKDCYKTVGNTTTHYSSYSTTFIDDYIHHIMKSAIQVDKLQYISSYFQGRFTITNKDFIPK